MVAYVVDGEVRGAAELHPPQEASGGLPEIAFSVEREFRRKGLGTQLFQYLIAEARRRGYAQLRITTSADNEAMRALAHKFGAHLTFRHGESTGTIDLTKLPPDAIPDTFGVPALAATAVGLNRAYWNFVMSAFGIGRAA